jgi:hypothetical protein
VTEHHFAGFHHRWCSHADGHSINRQDIDCRLYAFAPIAFSIIDRMAQSGVSRGGVGIGIN